MLCVPSWDLEVSGQGIIIFSNSVPFQKKSDFAEVDLGVASSDFTLVFFKPLLLDQNCSEKLRLLSERAFFDV